MLLQGTGGTRSMHRMVRPLIAPITQEGFSIPMTMAVCGDAGPSRGLWRWGLRPVRLVLAARTYLVNGHVIAAWKQRRTGW